MKNNTHIFVIISIVIIAVFILLKIYKSKTDQKSKQKRKFVDQNFVKKEYEQITVDLVKLKIKSEKWKEIEVENNSTEHKLNNLSDTGGDDNLKLIKKRVNNIIIKIPYKKGYIDYEIKTNMETTKLKLFFEMQKETKAQVDKTNRKIKHIDLSFLK